MPRTIKADRLAVAAVLNPGYRAEDGDISIAIKRTAWGSGIGVLGYRVIQTVPRSATFSTEEEIAFSSRDDWFARMPPAIGDAIVQVVDSHPGYMGRMGGSYEHQMDPARHEAAKEALRVAVAAWPEVTNAD